MFSPGRHDTFFFRSLYAYRVGGIFAIGLDGYFLYFQSLRLQFEINILIRCGVNLPGGRLIPYILSGDAVRAVLYIEGGNRRHWPKYHW